MLEKCPFCGAWVMFNGTICPNCQIDRSKPDLEQVAKRNRLESSVAESTWWRNLYNMGFVSACVMLVAGWYMCSAYSFNKKAASATATVISEPVSRATQFGVRRYAFQYEFVANGRNYKGVARSYPRLVDNLTIYYSKAEPRENRPDLPSVGFAASFFSAGALATLAFCLPWHRKIGSAPPPPPLR